MKLTHTHTDTTRVIREDSIQSDYQYGDVLCLVDKVLTTRNKNLTVFSCEHHSYFKTYTLKEEDKK